MKTIFLLCFWPWSCRNAWQYSRNAVHRLQFTYIWLFGHCKGGKRGWIGDVPKVQVDITKLKLLGWTPKYTSSTEACKKGIEQAIKFLLKN